MFKVYDQIDMASATKRLSQLLLKELKVGRVLWLVSGGSNLTLTAKVMETIPKELQPHLAIMLADERYGPPNHKNSNLYQLYKAGFQPGAAVVVPVLMPSPASLSLTIKRYEEALEQATKYAASVIAQLGIGSDSHIAGILPSSPAINSKKLVCGYKAADYVRITITPRTLSFVTKAVVFAPGRSKKTQLENLLHKNLSVNKAPAQLLKKLPDVAIYTDQKLKQA